MANCFLDRELSWLQFNLRVLKEAEDKNVPILERLKFLSIYNSNMDEFFMVRIGSLMHREVLMPEYRDPKTGWDTTNQLRHASQEVDTQLDVYGRLYKSVIADLEEYGIEVLDMRHLSKMEESLCKKVFSEIRAQLTPRISELEKPFPFLWNLDSSLVSIIDKGGKQKVGIVSLERIPEYRIFEINGIQKVIITSDLVVHYAKNLYKEYNHRESCVIRVTRNADVFIDDVEKRDDQAFKRNMEKLLRKRKRELPVRLQIAGKISQSFTELLEKKVGINARYTYTLNVPFSLSFQKDLKREPGMKYEERHPVKTVDLRKGEIFDYLEKKDILLSFPYQSMTPFIDLLYEAADDPEVESIKITLYRLASSSKVAIALAYAADQGKNVECLLELRARFDEQNNIDYSEMLEGAGCKILYGLPDYKVHSKVCLITRKHAGEVKFITQVGTGNYNEVTSEMYCDLSLITSDPACGRDAEKIFEALELGTLPVRMETLRVAPYSFKMPFIEELEIEKRKGSEGYVGIKVNSINDIDIMNKLIQCSRAGVRVELFVRGICCLKPGIPDYTHNIGIYSIVGRYLEHSRIVILGRGDDERIYIGSGDMLNRNTQRRIEAYIRVKDEANREQVREIMNSLRNDREKRWTMLPDTSYIKEDYIPGTSSQEYLYDYFTQKRIK